MIISRRTKGGNPDDMILLDILKIFMSAIIFNGRQAAAGIEEEIRRRTTDLKKQGIVPKMVGILVGDDPASRLYLRVKGRFASRTGIDFQVKEFSPAVSERELTDFIQRVGNSREVGGIMVQLPLPGKFHEEGRERKILEFIDPEKDVDCLTEENLHLVAAGKPRFLPAAVKAVITIIKIASCHFLAGGGRQPEVLVVGAKGMVGRPLVSYLSAAGAEVSGADCETQNLTDLCRRADILITATGRPGLIRKEMVKPGAVVIDVGSPKGDVDFGAVREIAGFITPVPGGVGPLTVAALFENLLAAIGRFHQSPAAEEKSANKLSGL